MNQMELVEALINKTGIGKDEARAAVKLFFNSMAEALIKGDRVEIRGLCTFHVKNYKGYTGRNPKTGETAQIPPKKKPFYKSGKQLKKLVNNLYHDTKHRIYFKSRPHPRFSFHYGQSLLAHLKDLFWNTQLPKQYLL